MAPTLATAATALNQRRYPPRRLMPFVSGRAGMWCLWGTLGIHPTALQAGPMGSKPRAIAGNSCPFQNTCSPCACRLAAHGSMAAPVGLRCGQTAEQLVRRPGRLRGVAWRGNRRDVHTVQLHRRCCAAAYDRPSSTASSSPQLGGLATQTGASPCVTLNSHTDPFWRGQSQHMCGEANFTGMHGRTAMFPTRLRQATLHTPCLQAVFKLQRM